MWEWMGICGYDFHTPPTTSTHHLRIPHTTGMNSRWQSSQHKVCIVRVGHWPSFLLLIPGKSYKLRTGETCDVIGHAIFMYDIYLNYTFG